jgi:hypothetical protein
MNERTVGPFNSLANASEGSQVIKGGSNKTVETPE